MKTLYTLIGLFIFIGVQAQVQDRTETDCDGVSKSIYETLEAGKPIIVASKGLDCSICMNQADNVADFANENVGNVEVWGAMTFRYSSAIPTCDQVNGWIDNYDWDNVFTFSDADEYWVTFGVPFYYLIDPATQEIVYEGPSFSTASNQALGLITVGIEENESVDQFLLYSSANELVIEIGSELAGTAELEVFDILGKEQYNNEVNITPGNTMIRFPFSSNEGIYIANLTFEGQTYSKKFLVNR